MDVSTQSCEVCGVLKGASNHWFRVVATDRSLMIMPWGQQLYMQAENEKHLCGDVCIGKLVQDWLGKQKAGGNAEGV